MIMSNYSPDNLRKLVIFEILSGWGVLAPFALGLTVAIGSWALSLGSAVTAFGLILSLISGGVFATKLLNPKAIEERILNRLKKEQDQKHRQELKELRESLAWDGIPDTERILNDLVALRSSLSECETIDNVRAVGPVIQAIESLYSDALKSLRRQLHLGASMRKVSIPDARQALQDQRNQIVEDLRSSVEEIARVVADLQVMSDSADNDLSEHRRNLTDRMEIVSNVQRQMNRWQNGVDLDELEQIVA